MGEYDHLPPLERAKKFRELAESAKRHAKCEPQARDAFLVVAAHWDDVAKQAESRARR
jgi:hypothetical protein